MKNTIEIHLIFANNSVARFTEIPDCLRFLISHLSFLNDPDTVVGKDDVLLSVLSSGLSTEDETHINWQVNLNKGYQIRSKADDKKVIN